MPRHTHYKEKELFRSAINTFSKDILKVIEKDLPSIEDELNDTALSIISKWYADYEPLAYHRIMSLKKAFKVTVNAEKFSIDYDSSYMKDFYHHQSNEYVFNNSFILGYHGGSTDKSGTISIPQWRKPLNIYSEWYGTPAPQSFSPYETIEKEGEKVVNKKWNPVKKKLEKDVGRIIDHYTKAYQKRR